MHWSAAKYKNEATNKIYSSFSQLCLDNNSTVILTDG